MSLRLAFLTGTRAASAGAQNPSAAEDERPEAATPPARCNECAGPVSTRAWVCPHCGGLRPTHGWTGTPTRPVTARRFFGWLIVVVIVLELLAVLMAP